MDVHDDDECVVAGLAQPEQQRAERPQSATPPSWLAEPADVAGAIEAAVAGLSKAQRKRLKGKERARLKAAAAAAEKHESQQEQRPFTPVPAQSLAAPLCLGQLDEAAASATAVAAEHERRLAEAARSEALLLQHESDELRIALLTHTPPVVTPKAPAFTSSSCPLPSPSPSPRSTTRRLRARLPILHCARTASQGR